jgi:thioesterase domain-containing protein/aryl carrier-like protein
MIPAAFVPLEALPLTANGKVDRKALPALVADRTAGGTHVAPRTEVEAVLCEIWQRVLRVERVGIEDNFFDLGGDSIVSIQIAAEAREAGVQIGVQELFRAPTIAALAEAAAETALLAGAKEWSPVVSISTTGTRPPIFCVHPLGGGVGAYRDLARHLGSDQPFHALQAKEFSEPPTVRDAADSIEQMAARYVDAIRAIQPRGPICLAGWSFGGAVAYEMARQLEGAGLFVNLVALLDSRPGSERIEEIDEGSILYWAAAELAVRVGKTMPVTWQDLHRVDPADRRTYLAEKLRPITMVNADAGLQMADPLMKWIRIRERMWKQYRPGPCSAPIVMFRASEADDGIDAASMPEALEPARGWEAIAHAPVHVEWIPGSHLTLVTEPHVRVLAARLAAWIGRVADRPSIAQMTLRAH